MTVGAADFLEGPQRADSYTTSPPSSFTEKKRGLEVAVEEGRQKAQELAAAAAKDGSRFFHHTIDSAEGNLTLLSRAFAAADAAPLPAPAGGASSVAPAHQPPKLGKMFVSAGEKQLALVAHVPAELAKQSGVRVREWVGEALKHIKGGQVVEADDETVKAVARQDSATAGGGGPSPAEQMQEAIAAGMRYMRDKTRPPMLTR